MSQKNPKAQPQQPKNIQPNITMEITRDQITQALGNAKRRISQRKGELLDTLSDQISQEFSGIHQGVMSLFDQIDVLKRRIAELENPPTSKE